MTKAGHDGSRSILDAVSCTQAGLNDISIAARAAGARKAATGQNRAPHHDAAESVALHWS